MLDHSEFPLARLSFLLPGRSVRLRRCLVRRCFAFRVGGQAVSGILCLRRRRVANQGFCGQIESSSRRLLNTGDGATPARIRSDVDLRTEQKIDNRPVSDAVQVPGLHLVHREQDSRVGVVEFKQMPAEAQGKWFEWLVAQELWRRRCIPGEQIPESLPYWQSREHGLHYVLAQRLFLEVKRGQASPFEFTWFNRVFPTSNLIVVNASQFETQAIKGVTFEQFLGAGGG